MDRTDNIEVFKVSFGKIFYNVKTESLESYSHFPLVPSPYFFSFCCTSGIIYLSVNIQIFFYS